MTVIQIHDFGRASGICPRCKRTTGNLAKHEPACKRAHEAFYAPLDDETYRQIERAGAHSGFGEPFRSGITDLDVARVLLHLERGRMIAQGGSRWVAEKGSPAAARGNLARVVDEMIRTGLAVGLSDRTGVYRFKVVLRAAPVHLRGRTDHLRPSCEAEALRYRIVDHPSLADCPTCLA